MLRQFQNINQIYKLFLSDCIIVNTEGCKGYPHLLFGIVALKVHGLLELVLNLYRHRRLICCGRIGLMVFPNITENTAQVV